jgi:hypothetical protein
MGFNNISNDFSISLKELMNYLYDINFQFNGEFDKIRIRYNVIHDWSIINHLKK